jgi:CheY-like chemotaxis protein
MEWIRQGDPFDMAVLDYQMPVMDGIALARAIRQLSGARPLALVLLSSIGQPLTDEHRDVGFAAVLSKPVKPSQLQDQLCQIVEALPGPTPPVAGPLPREPAAAIGDLRILVAEDNPANQRVALRLLERLGYQADFAASGREVLERLSRDPYDVVLMDVQMPEMDGLEATRAICARWPAGTRPRIIAMTAEAMEGDREACLAAGMDDYVVKPVRLDRLSRALGQCRPVGDQRATTSEAPPAGSAPPAALDREVLRQLEEELGGAEALRQIVATFLDSAPGFLAALRDAAGRGDPSGMERAAHTLKSTSAMLGATALSVQCAELERLGRAGTVPDALSRVAAIETLYGAVALALRTE